MIADLDQAPKERVEKPVWRVAFFGRLEERKGIKLFVDAVQVSHYPFPAIAFRLPPSKTCCTARMPHRTCAFKGPAPRHCMHVCPGCHPGEVQTCKDLFLTCKDSLLRSWMSYT